MKRITAVLLAGLLFIGISLAVAQDKPTTDETRGQESKQNGKIIDNPKLTKSLNYVDKWMKGNKYPGYVDYVFEDLAKFESDPRVFKLYCDVLENSSNLMAKLFAINGLKRINNSSAIPILKKSLTDDSIIIRCISADILFNLGERDSAYSAYIEILSMNDLEDKLNKEVPELIKLTGDYSEKTSRGWDVKAKQFKTGLVESAVEKVLNFDTPEAKKTVKNILNNGKMFNLTILKNEIDSNTIEYENLGRRINSMKNKNSGNYGKILNNEKDTVEKKKTLLEKLEGIGHE